MREKERRSMEERLRDQEGDIRRRMEDIRFDYAAHFLTAPVPSILSAAAPATAFQLLNLNN